MHESRVRAAAQREGLICVLKEGTWGPYGCRRGREKHV